MAKFVIECPQCGKFVEGKTGFLASKKLNCSCGNVINVRTDKLTSRQCPHCGNTVVYDQTKGEKATCPVCHEPINNFELQDKMITFSCKQCGVRLNTAKGVEKYRCPVCEHENIVSERLMSEKIKNDGLASVIKYEGDNETLVWKHPIEDFNLGSQLIVHESQEAIFYRDGQALDLFGAGRYTLETQQLPVLEKLYKLPTDTEGTFHSEVYYVNMATQMGIKWGTDSKVGMFDPGSGLHIEIGASGDFNIRVVNSRKLLLKLVGTTGGLKQGQLLGNSAQRTVALQAGGIRAEVTQEVGTKGFFRTMVMTQVKSFLASTIRENGISILEIDERLMDLSEALMAKLNPRLSEYGLEISEFFINRIVCDDPNVQRLKEQYAQETLEMRDIKRKTRLTAAERDLIYEQKQNERTEKVMDAESDLQVAKLEADAYRAKAAAEADEMLMKATAEAEEMKRKGYTYQQETARMVGMEAMQNGLTGNGTGGGAVGGITGSIGDIASLGVTLGAMGSMVNMTREAMSPVMDAATQMSQAATAPIGAGGWDCSCGQKNIASNFCPGCGSKKPEPQSGWTCKCGTADIMSNFCPNCGSKKPEPVKGWTCGCGTTDIMTNFCPNCGNKKPQEDLGWTCPECGKEGIKSNFCPDCGHKK